jgi:hypothetical protein
MTTLEAITGTHRCVVIRSSWHLVKALTGAKVDPDRTVHKDRGQSQPNVA